MWSAAEDDVKGCHAAIQLKRNLEHDEPVRSATPGSLRADMIGVNC
jgi:hypothetical protein